MNVFRREVVSKLLYRDSGLLFPRHGKLGEPVIPKSVFLLSSEGTGPVMPMHPVDLPIDPPMPMEDRNKIFNKVIDNNCIVKFLKITLLLNYFISF